MDGPGRLILDRLEPQISRERATLRQMAADSLGGLYVVGSIDWPREWDRFRWIVRKSDDDGKSWRTIDDWGLPSETGSGFELGSQANGIVIDDSDVIYVSGNLLVLANCCFGSRGGHYVMRQLSCIED